MSIEKYNPNPLCPRGATCRELPANMSRTSKEPKHPPRPLFLTPDPKIIFRRKSLPRKNLEKSEKNSLAKSRSI
jgi:hypothetical protein